jgi:8-oxo-dGTP pyrophosphatase MutT (NUDIX family)
MSRRTVANASNGLPEQAAAIAVRRNGGTLQVCLIRKKGSKTWGIPKGLVDPGDTHEETALNEAWEEAGLQGRLIGDAVGIYEYEKWNTTFAVAVYPYGAHCVGRFQGTDSGVSRRCPWDPPWLED